MPLTPRRKRRTLLTQMGTGTQVSDDIHSIFLTKRHVVTKQDLGEIKGSQVTDSEGNPVRHLGKGDLRDIGSDFFTQKKYVNAENIRDVTFSTTFWSDPRTYTIRYTGPVWPSSLFGIPGTSGITFPPAMNSSMDQLDELGATAVARCKPTNPVADLAVFLGELYTGGLPTVPVNLWRQSTQRILRKKKSKGDAVNVENTQKALEQAAQEHLNIQYGLLPIVNDVGKFAHAAVHAEKVLRQYERDAGKVVRRRYRFPSTSEVSVAHVGNGAGVYYTPFNSQHMDSAVLNKALTRVREIKRSQWFSGAFTYHLPVGYDSRQGMASAASKAQVLLGFSLTPETLWELAPWSWAVDWFSNTGDVLSNVSDMIEDGLIMRYGYVMEHTTVTDTYTLQEPRPFKDKSIVVPSVSLITETKIRRKANPFGFGVTWDGLSPLQLSIAAALGLSRGKR